VVAAVGASTRGPGGRPDDPGPLSAAFAALAEAADWTVDHWREPDAGRWEIERPLRLYTAGRIEVWSALGRMARLARAANPLDLQAAGWLQESGDVLTWLEAEAAGADGGLRMEGRAGGPDEADAALLAVAWSGPWPAAHPVVVSTVDRVLERLASGPFLHRYSDRVADERAGPDYPDLEASLLAVRALAGLGRWDEAHERIEAITGVVEGAGPGLLAETVDPVGGQLYGNLPSTTAELALVDAALALEFGPR
jgi:GH15 family glucan-1,4-alpha-glucosidase